MDNNNPNPVPPQAPQPGFQPMGQPGMPQSQSPMGNQMGQPMGQPMMNQGMPQPYPQPVYQQPIPPKQPMDPKKKKAIITWCCIGGGIIVLGIAAAIVLPIVLRVDYSTAYHTAKDLQSPIQDIYYNYDCGYVESYLDSTGTSIRSYTEYVENCKNDMSGAGNLVSQLGETEGVKRNSDIKNQFESFKSIYDSTIPNYDDLAKKLDVYLARHSFVVAADDISYSSSDSEITAAANYLINSGNETLKTYGEGWLEKYLAAAHAYQDWYNSSGYFNDKYDLKNQLDTERKNYVTANRPDIKSLYPLNLENTSKIYTEFEKLYDLISDTYEKNYNKDSGDCLEFLGEVVCD